LGVIEPKYTCFQARYGMTVAPSSEPATASFFHSRVATSATRPAKPRSAPSGRERNAAALASANGTARRRAIATLATVASSA
jgi:hypothetical protein